MRSFKKIICSHFHFLFVLPFLTVSLFLLQAPFIWDEGLYFLLANHVIQDPLSIPYPFLYWVPHPPLLWYLLALFYPLPRLAVLLSSAVCLFATFYACKRLWGDRVAQTSVACLVSTIIYPLYSLVLFNDILVTTFMTVSTLSFLIWLKSLRKKFLFLSSLNVSLASLSKYTAVPILTVTFIIWLTSFRKRLGPRKFVFSLAVLALSSLPLMLWINEVSLRYVDIIPHYSSSYAIPNFQEFSLTFLYYVTVAILMAGLPLVFWKRNMPFDEDSKLILIYASVIFIFFLFLKQHYARYFLPLSPAFAVISGRAVAEKKLLVKFLALFPQLVVGLCILALFVHY